MSCSSCNSTPCSCPSTTGGYNWYNTDDQPCNPCYTTSVCARKYKAACVDYNGPSLTALGLTTNLNIEIILSTISLAIQTLNNAITAQNLKNTTILTALNDLNSRLNVEAGTAIPPYTY